MIKKLIILFLVILLIQISLFAYRAIACWFESNYVVLLDLDENGNLSVFNTIQLDNETENILIPFSVDFAYTYYGYISIFNIENNNDVYYLGFSDLSYSTTYATISSDDKYLIITHSVDACIKLFRINSDFSLSDTGSFLPFNSDLDPPEEHFSPREYAESKYNNTIIGNNWQIKQLCILKRTEDEELIDTGQRISTDPYGANNSVIITPNGRYCYISGNSGLGGVGGTVYCEILPDGEVVYKGLATDLCQSNHLRITKDGRFFVHLANGIRDYRIEENGNLTFINSITGLDLSQAFDVTPDNKYIVVSWNYNSYGQTVSVIRMYPDGTLEKLDKDQFFPGHFSDIRFIPPYVTSAEDEIWQMYE